MAWHSGSLSRHLWIQESKKFTEGHLSMGSILMVMLMVDSYWLIFLMIDLPDDFSDDQWLVLMINGSESCLILMG